MDTLVQEVRYAIRMVLRTPLLSIVAVLTIGLGVGSVTFAYGVVDGTVLRGLPVRNPDRLMVVEQARPDDGVRHLGTPIHDYLDYRDLQTSFEHLSVVAPFGMNLAGEEGPPERFTGALVAADLFPMIGVKPILGRGFAEGDDAAGQPALLLLGHSVWKNRFAADPGVLGRSVRVNGETATIIGVMPEGFRFPWIHDLWLPLRVDAGTLPRRTGPALLVTGYLREGVSRAAAGAEMRAFAARLEEAYPETNQGITNEVSTFADGIIPPSISSMIILLFPLGAGVLLVACANIANILLSRAVGRERDMAVRTALGARRSRVVRQLLMEAVVLGLAGGAVGIALAYAGLQAFSRNLWGIQIPYWIDYRIDTAALIVTLVVTIGAALTAGIVPALRASKCEVGNILRDESRGSSGLRMGRLSTCLVVGELAISSGLMLGAGLLVRALVNLNEVDLGFQSEGVTTARLALRDAEYPSLEDCNRFYHRLLDRLNTEPGLQSAALTSAVPATMQNQWAVQVDGVSYPLPADVPVVGGAVVSTGFFQAFGVQLREGRDFTRAETEEGVPAVVIVNQAYADRYLGGREALGRRIRLGRANGEQQWLEVVGVAPNLFEGVGAYGGGGRRREAIYLPLSQATPRYLSIAVRSEGSATDVAASLRTLTTEIDANLPLYWVMPMQSSLDESTMWHTIFGGLFFLFACAALFLAVVGLYGIVNFSVASRLHEMGIRMAMGARPGTVGWLVARRVLWQLGVGGALGLLIGWGLGKPLSTSLAGVPAWDSVVAGVIFGTLIATGLLATLVPAAHAMRVDPATAFRS